MRMTTDLSGVLILDKPPGPTSHDLVARVRKSLRTRRVGHAGTLDPFASGVLVVGVGRGTRLLPYLQQTDKVYQATVRLGQATSTDDYTGTTLSSQSAAGISVDDVQQALASFRGSIWQRPSAVSAIKVAGQRAHKRVRAGQEVEIPAREVFVDSLTMSESTRPNSDLLDVKIELRCSTGTYVRAIARDLGQSLGCGGHLTALRRTAVGPFTTALAHRADADDLSTVLHTLGWAATAVLPTLEVDETTAAWVANGRQAPTDAEGIVALLRHQQLLAVAEAVSGRWVYRAVFV